MKRLLISGVCGRMGRLLAQASHEHGMLTVAGVDAVACEQQSFPVYRHFSQVREAADVLVDFSVPGVLGDLLDHCQSHALPCVLGTTVYTEEDMKRIQKAADDIPIFWSPNMSRGVYVLTQLAARAAQMLDGFDVEIIEKHHKQKVDSPSGTALSLLNAVRKPDSSPVFGREGKSAKRAAGEIGVHAVRGGTVAGEHEVGFYGDNEVIILSHQAQNRGVFVAGALSAAGWLTGRQPGLYGMADLMG